jgi:RimJ/RimL family protein N-acetyltransferase
MAGDFLLETERLSLRWLTLDDADLMLAVWNDPAFVRHVGDRGIRTIEEAHTAMQRGAFHLYETYGYGPYRVALKDTDVAVGLCGLFRRANLDVADIGYAVLPAHCGEGYAYEASMATIGYARDKLGLQRLYGIVSPSNVVSAHLVGKLGLRFERMHRMPDEEGEVCLYSMRLRN